MKSNNSIVTGVLVLVAIVLLGLLVKNYNDNKDHIDVVEVNEQYQNDVLPSEESDNAQPKEVDFPSTDAPSKCFPRDRLSASDLLPKDAANNEWSQVTPAGQGDVDGRNYITSGTHLGINTTGSSLRNANRQLRSEPANPQVNVGPWMKSTITPDMSRRPLE